MMTGDRAMRTTCGLDDTQLMLARDAGDERGSSAIALPGADGAGRVAGVIKSGRVRSSFVRRKMATSAMGQETTHTASRQATNGVANWKRIHVRQCVRDAPINSSRDASGVDNSLSSCANILTTAPLKPLS